MHPVKPSPASASRHSAPGARPRPRWRLLAWVAATGLATAAMAQSPQPSEPASAPVEDTPQALPTVQTSVQRGNFMPYKQLNEVLLTLKTEGEGLFVGRPRIRSSQRAQPLPANATLVLMNEERTINLPIDADGRFELPIFSKDEAKDMELGTNLPKGSVELQLRIDLTTPPDQLDMATVRRVVRVGQHLRNELLPWYVRWLVPQIDGVMVCSSKPDWQLGWTENAQGWVLPLPADATLKEPDTDGSKDKDKPSRPCTALTGQESWPDSARLQVPAADRPKLYIRLRQTRAS